jgi:hypothetical protein
VADAPDGECKECGGLLRVIQHVKFDERAWGPPQGVTVTTVSLCDACGIAWLGLDQDYDPKYR